MFYRKKDKIPSNDLTTTPKKDINFFLKSELSIFRKSFIDVLPFVYKKFADQMLTNVDEFVVKITEDILNET